MHQLYEVASCFLGGLRRLCLTAIAERRPRGFFVSVLSFRASEIDYLLCYATSALVIDRSCDTAGILGATDAEERVSINNEVATRVHARLQRHCGCVYDACADFSAAGRLSKRIAAAATDWPLLRQIRRH